MCAARRRKRPHARQQRARLWFNLGWGLVQVIVVFTLFCAGVLAGAYAGIHVIAAIFPSTPADNPVDDAADIGLVIGVISGLTINHNSRRWLHRWQRHRLRTRGVRVIASVTNLEHSVSYNPQGPNVCRYTLHLRWSDPQSQRTCQAETHYRFLGNKSARFESACTATVAVWCDPRRSKRFVVDIPFAPSMADLVLGRATPGPGD
jgi:hypothetical protein